MERTTGLRRWGYTLPELAIVLTILALVASIGVHTIGRELDRMAAQGAVGEAASALALARDEALARHALVGVVIDTADGSIVVRGSGGRLARHALAHAYGVLLRTSRDSVVFDARGLGYGAANLTLVARRGSAAETLVVSRLGRVRR